MSGLVAERLLNLVPPYLDAATRFDLVKKLRTAHLRSHHRHLTTAPERWKSDLAPILSDLVQSSSSFRLPGYVINKARWLADGDTDAAQKLLAAAEQEEAVVRLRYLEAEFQRIEFLIQNIKETRSVSHRIELPQGSISITIELPKKTLWQRFLDW